MTKPIGQSEDFDIKVKEPHLPEDFKLIIQQLGMVIEMYHELIMVWVRPPTIIFRSKKDK